MPPPATTDELFDVIGRSGLLTADAVRSYLPPPGRLMNSEAILSRMVRDGVVTPFQAKHLAVGRHRGFFLNDKYKLLAHLGAGGIGHVYLCEHLLLHRLVAVKILQATAAGESSGAVERFFREARAVAALDDPNIVRVFDMDRSGNAPFMVMEYVDGTNLHAVVATGGPMTVARAANYARQAALGLAHAHAVGLVHRDVKPGNLLVDRGGVVKLLDLGLARFFTDPEKNKNLTSQYDANTIVGTADFIAPEQTHDSSSVDIRADIYGLGGTLYYFLTGRSPFEHGTVAQKLLWHQTKPPPPIADFRTGVPEELVAVVEKMLAKEPKDRYDTPDAVVEALAPWGAHPVPPPAPEEMPRMPASSYRLGLSPPPSSTLTRTAPSGTPITAPGSSRSGQRTGELDDVTKPHAAIADPPSAETADSPVLVLPTARVPRPNRRRGRLLAAAAVLVTGIAAGVWFGFGRSGRPSPDGMPPPTRGEPVSLRLGGSTFVQKAVRLWTAEYPGRERVRFAPYADGGSGVGKKGLLAGEYDLCCTDEFFSDAEIDAARAQGKDLVHIPLVMGAVVPTYNLPDVKVPLMFDSHVLAGIYLGTVTAWDDKALRDCNKSVRLPNRPIEVVYRSDESGTTAIWSEFLHKKGGLDWQQTMGPPAKRLKVPPPKGIAAAKNDGVAASVAEKPGRIGYVELTYALEKELAVGMVKNAENNYAMPSLASVSAAADAPEGVRKDLRFSLIDMPGPNTYPICGTAWAVFDAKMADPHRRKAIADFLKWVTHDGQTFAGNLKYAPLPREIVSVIASKLAPLQGE